MKQNSIAGGAADLDPARNVQDSPDVSPSPVRDAILRQFQEVAASQGKAIKPLTDDLVLLNSGLDSLCFAIIVAELEDTLGIDPFSSAEEVYFPVTFGDFISFYENAAG
ncbi:MAG: acyl carrier protein [Caulobacteraceae bacterium]|nr:acyl carrier protein [Caulobacteraceae bacterium]